MAYVGGLGFEITVDLTFGGLVLQTLSTNSEFMKVPKDGVTCSHGARAGTTMHAARPVRTFAITKAH